MAQALSMQASQPEIDSLTFEERLGLLLDQEVAARENRRLQTRLRKAKLKQEACWEDVDYQTPRGLDKGLLSLLSSGQWIHTHHNILLVGPTGTGKTFLACALGHKACLHGDSVCYHRLSRLLTDLELSKSDGRYLKLMGTLVKTDVLILDDFGLAPYTDEQQRAFLELLDDRYEKRATIVTSQLPIQHWHEAIGNATLADAILDRLINRAYRVEMRGESMRKIKSRSTTLLTQEIKSDKQ